MSVVDNCALCRGSPGPMDVSAPDWARFVLRRVRTAPRPSWERTHPVARHAHCPVAVGVSTALRTGVSNSNPLLPSRASRCEADFFRRPTVARGGTSSVYMHRRGNPRRRTCECAMGRTTRRVGAQPLVVRRYGTGGAPLSLPSRFGYEGNGSKRAPLDA